jgi:hypothetical protein
MVSNNFKNVYVFDYYDGAFHLKETIAVSSPAGIQNPEFNQRPPFIELVFGENSSNKIELTPNGIKREDE